MVQSSEGIPLTSNVLHMLVSNWKIISCYLHLVLRLRGMISNFSQFDKSDPLTSYLMKGDVDRLELSKELLKQKRRDLFGSEISEITFNHTAETYFK